LLLDDTRHYTPAQQEFATKYAPDVLFLSLKEVCVRFLNLDNNGYEHPDLLL